jgi:hypothetical protein
MFASCSSSISVLSNVSFQHHSAENSAPCQSQDCGGALWVEGSGSLLVLNGVFADNRNENSDTRGAGAVGLTQQIRATFNGTQFLRNSGSQGGALFASDDACVVAVGCSILSNVAEGFGTCCFPVGAGFTIWNCGKRNPPSSIRNCTFAGNTNLEGYGGALNVRIEDTSFKQGETFIEHVIFSQNRIGEYDSGLAKFWGFGGAAMHFERALHLRLNNCTFDENSVGKGCVGGAIRAYHLDNGDCVFTGCAFRSNSAAGAGIQGGGQGGAIHIDRGNSRKYIFVECQFNSNSANFGGAVSGSGSNDDEPVRFFDSTFSNNSAVVVPGLLRGGSGAGGALFSWNMPLHISGCGFISNIAGWSGGALHAQTELFWQVGTTLTVRIVSASFRSNTAGVQGGALAFLANDAVPLNLAFLACTTGPQLLTPAQYVCGHGYGGLPPAAIEGVFREWSLPVVANIVDVSFVGNVASTAVGGAISALNTRLVNNRAHYQGNRALVGGGALYLDGASSLSAANTSLAANNRVSSIIGSRGGHQILSDAGGSLTFLAGTSMGAGEGLAVIAPFVGEVTWGIDARVTCPVGMLAYSQQALQNASTGGWLLQSGTSRGRNNSNCPSFFRDCGLGIVVKPKMLVTDLSVSCNACPAGRYSAVQAHTGGTQNEVSCLACPFRGDCNNGLGGVVATNGVWGRTHSGSNADEAAVIEFASCPPKYCCGSAVCNGTAQCADGSFRDPTAPLCGGCLAGYSESVDSTNCLPDSECGRAGWWFWPSVLLFFVAYNSFFMWTGSGVGKIDAEDTNRRPSLAVHGAPRSCRHTLRTTFAWDRFLDAGRDGGVAAIVYYFQMAAVVVPTKGPAWMVSSFLGPIFNMHPSSGQGVCLFAGQTTVAKVSLNFAVPFVMMLVLYWMYVVLRTAGILRASLSQRRQRQRAEKKTELDFEPSATERFLDNDDSSCEEPPEFSGHDSSVNQDSDLHIDTAKVPKAKEGGHMLDRDALRMRAVGALAQLWLFAFSSVSGAVFTLLHCVQVPGESAAVLFEAGSVRCGTWQHPLYAFAGVFVFFACTPLCIAGMRLLPKGRFTSRLQNWSSNLHWPTNLISRAVRVTLVTPFKAEMWAWPALMALQRLMMVAAHSLSTNRVICAMAMLLITALALCSQFLYMPHKNRDVNILQCVASFSLAFLTGLNVPLQAFKEAGIDVTAAGAGTTVVTIASALNTAMACFVLLPLATATPLSFMGFRLLGVGHQARNFAQMFSWRSYSRPRQSTSPLPRDGRDTDASSRAPPAPAAMTRVFSAPS